MKQEEDTRAEDILAQQEFDFDAWLESNGMNIEGERNLDKLQRLKNLYALPIRTSTNSNGKIKLEFSNDLEDLEFAKVATRFPDIGG